MDYTKLVSKVKRLKPNHEGSSRKVYFQNDLAIKVAKNKRGLIESLNEITVYNNIDKEIKKYLCPILYSNDDGVVVMPKAEPISSSDFKNIYSSEVELVIGILYEKFLLDDFDLLYNFNWGTLNGQLVVLDYGHTFLGDEIVI